MDEFQVTQRGDEQVKGEKLSSLEREAIEKMMSNLLDELKDEQRNKVKDLLIRHRSIMILAELISLNTESILANIDRFVSRFADTHFST